MSACDPFQEVLEGHRDAFATKIGTTDFRCGDCDGNDAVSVTDMVYLYNYVFGHGPPPDPLEAGNVDECGLVNVLEAAYLGESLLRWRPAPCDPNGDGVPDC